MPGSSKNSRPVNLVIQMARLGDFLQTTPLLAAIKAASPEGRLACLVTPAQAPLARGCRHIDQIIEFSRGDWGSFTSQNWPNSPEKQAEWTNFIRPLAGTDPQRVYNLNLSPFTARVAAAWPRARQMAWHLNGGNGGLANQPWVRFVMGLVSDRSLTRLHLCDILLSYADPASPGKPELDFTPSDQGREKAAELIPDGIRPVVLQLGANSPLRSWPLEYFSTLAGGLISQGFTPVLVGTQAEDRFGQRLRSNLDRAGEKVLDFMGHTDLDTLGAVLARSELVVSADTGTLHLATAVGAKVLALFMGPAQAHETGPYGSGHLVLQSRDHCGPCQENQPSCNGRAHCRFLLKPGPVLQACLNLLENQPPNQAGQNLNLAPGVHALVSKSDSFGLHYRPLSPQPLDKVCALALGLREAGRVLLRNSYDPDPALMKHELSLGHLPPAEKEKDWLGSLARQTAALNRALENSPGKTLSNMPAIDPELGFLSALADSNPPPRLAKACRAAARFFESAASF